MKACWIVRKPETGIVPLCLLRDSIGDFIRMVRFFQGVFRDGHTLGVLSSR